MKKKKRPVPKVKITDATNGEFMISCSKKVPKGIYELTFTDNRGLELVPPIKIEVI